MSDKGQDHFEIPKEMRSMAEASFEQARQTFEKFFTTAQQAAGSFEERGATVRAGAKDISSRAITYAEKNVQASLDYAQSLLKAKDLTGSDAVARRICAGADARPGGAGQRDGPDRQPRRDRGGEAEELTRAHRRTERNAAPNLR